MPRTAVLALLILCAACSPRPAALTEPGDHQPATLSAAPERLVPVGASGDPLHPAAEPHPTDRTDVRIPLPDVWRVHHGQTLRSHLETWATRANWNLHYRTSRDWNVEADGATAGTFLDAVGYLGQGFEHARPAPRFEAWTENRVLIVDDDGTDPF